MSSTTRLLNHVWPSNPCMGLLPTASISLATRLPSTPTRTKPSFSIDTSDNFMSGLYVNRRTDRVTSTNAVAKLSESTRQVEKNAIQAASTDNVLTRILMLD